jgi:hydrogenase maturation protease
MPAGTGTTCLILACGNPLRGDDGAAWYLADALQRNTLPDGIRILVQQQWTPELAADIAEATSVLFLDSSLSQAPGSVTLRPVSPASAPPSFLTHHLDASSLLALTQSLYLSAPTHSSLLLIGAETVEHGESLSPIVEGAIPKALNTALAWINRHCLHQAPPSPGQTLL